MRSEEEKELTAHIMLQQAQKIGQDFLMEMIVSIRYHSLMEEPLPSPVSLKYLLMLISNLNIMFIQTLNQASTLTQ